MRHHCQGPSRSPQSTPVPVLSCILMLTFRDSACLYNYTAEQTEFFIFFLEIKISGNEQKGQSLTSVIAVWGSVMKV